MSTPTSPESVYPYHLEAWRQICELSEASLTKVEPAKGEDFVSHIWRVNRLGFACRLERPSAEVSDNTVYILGFEDYVPGQRYFGKLPYIVDGLRRPVRRNPRNYGILEYSQAQGLIKNPEGVLPDNLIRKKVNMNNPEKRIVGYEDLLKSLLEYAPRGWEEPLKIHHYRK